MPFLTFKPVRVSLLIALLATLVAACPVSNSVAAKPTPECSDGIDNDSDNAIDGVDSGCQGGDDDSEAITVYQLPGETIPLPVVTIQGTVTAKGVVEVSLFRIRAVRGSTVRITCKGTSCPFKKSNRQMVTSTLNLSSLQRKLKPKLKLELRIGLPDALGKYMSYTVRRNKPPVRLDRCVSAKTGKIKGCFAG